jgi:hypothetical protein
MPDFIHCGRRSKHPFKTLREKTVMVAVPDQVSSNIGPSGDTDSYSVYLRAGHSYDFDVYGWGNGDHDHISPGIFDPTLTLTGHGVHRFDDDGGAYDWDSHIDFTAGTTGWYTLTVAGYHNETGPYTLYTDYNDGVLPVV